MKEGEFICDGATGLYLPMERCRVCRGERLYTDVRGNRRCMRCVPPSMVMAKLRQEKLEALEREKRMVDDFLTDDEEIQDYNERHHGVRTS